MMTFLLIVLALLTGLSAGLAVGCFILLRDANRQIRALDIERMLWTNKTLIRQGQMPIFTPEMVGEDTHHDMTGTAVQMRSPFSAGRQKLKESLRKENEPGANLPESIKAKIKEAKI